MKKENLTKVKKIIKCNEESTGLTDTISVVAAKYLYGEFVNTEPMPGIFKRKFIEEISGNGNELVKMNSIYSSSLLAFLFFVWVNKDNPLTINGIDYKDVFFEVKNKVFNADSNIDVVLTNDENILFIECKFTEYLEPSSCKISTKYKENSVFRYLIESNDILHFNNDGNDKYQAHYNNKPIYTYGIKQIIAHNIGIENYISNNNIDERIKPNLTPHFLEVVFDFNPEFQDELNNYRAAIEELRKKYNSENNERFLPFMTYQDILKQNDSYKEKLPEKIKDYYNLI